MTAARIISLIVACDDNRLIGRDGDLPWRLPNDLRHFKALTLGKTVLMGRKTWVSLGRPLPQRENWVLTREAGFDAPGARVFTTLQEALAAHTAGELMVIGGADLYRQTLPLAQRLYLTRVHAVLRRSAPEDAREGVLRIADLELDENSHEVTRAGVEVHLTATEFELLRYLMRNERVVLSKAQILDRVWKYDFQGQSNIVELYIGYLRKKIDSVEPKLIHTIRGAGYVIKAPRQ